MITKDKFNFTAIGTSPEDRLKWIQGLKYDSFKPEVDNEKVFEVNLNSRAITVPKGQDALGVQDDMNAEIIWFAVPRYFEGQDLGDTEKKKWLIHVTVNNPNPNAREILLPINYVETEKTINQTNFTFGTGNTSTDGILLGWSIPYDVTRYPGPVSFALRCYEIDAERNIIFSLGTKEAKGRVEGSYSLNGQEIPDGTETVFPEKSVVMEMLEELQRLFGGDGDPNLSYENLGTAGMPSIDGEVLTKNKDIKFAYINGTKVSNTSEKFELVTPAKLDEVKTELNNSISANVAAIETLNTDLDAAADRIGDLEDLVGSGTGGGESLASKVSANEKAIAENAKDIAANEKLIKENATNITTNQKNIATLESNLNKTISANKDELEGKITELSNSTSKHFISLEGTVGENTEAIESLKSDLGLVEGAEGETLPSRVKSNEESIEKINAELGLSDDAEPSETGLMTRVETLESVLGLSGEGGEIPEGSLPEKVQENADAIAAILAEAPEDLNTFAEVKAALDKVGVSEEDKTNIINTAVEDVFTDSRYTVLSGKVGSIDALNEVINASETGLKPRVEALESKIDLGDNENLKIQYEEAESLLYLFEGDTLVKPDLENDIEGNVISTTTVTGGSGGGGTSVLNYNLLVKSSNPTTMFFADNENVVLNFRAELTDNDAPEGEDDKVSGSINFKITLTETTSQTKKTINFKEQSNTDLTYDITKYLSIGTWSIAMVATYSEVIEGLEAPYVKTARKTWSASIVNLSLTINDFNYNDIKTKDVNIGYTVKGDLNKTLYWSIDGGELQSRPNISVFEYSDTLLIPMQSHGSHTVEIYAKGTKSGSSVEIETKPHTVLDIMFVDQSSDVPVIRAVADAQAERQQYGLIPISFTVYQKDKDKVDITLTVMSDGEVESTSSRSVLTLTEQTWDYRPLTAGNKTLIIQCGDATKELELEIEEFPYAITPVTTNLAFDFNPEGRTNEDANFDIFEDRGVTWTVSENFDWSNGGWKTDEDGSSYFCIKAGTSVDFNYNLFEDTNTLGTSAKQGNGKEFKVVFKTANVADSRATWLSCLANTEKNKPTGIKMNIQNGYVSSDLNTLTIPYSEEDIIEFDMNIVPFGSSNEKNIPMIMTYEDGTPVQPIVLTDETASFTQEVPVPITIGSTDCDVHLYRMKAYSSFLSDKQILDNFIADARTGTEKADRYLRNQIYNALTGKLTPEDLANACPDLRIIKISAPRFTKGKINDKWDKVKNTTIEMIYKNGREEDNWIATGCQHTGQGTSSNGYGQAGRNLDLIMKAKDGAVITIKDTNEVKKKVSLTETSVPVDYFNIKVNIASSENANNALLQKRFDRYLPYTPASHVHTPEAKTTMEFYNCVVFVQETGAEKVEFSDDAWHFYAIGNIGDSKKTDSSRASDPDDTNEFCVEIMDWNRALSSFPEDTMVKASTYIQKDNAGNITDYNFLVQDNLGKTEESAEPKLYEKQASGYVLTQDTEIDLANLDKYYVDILLNDDFSEDYTYGFRYLNDDEDPEQIAKAKAKWIEFYRFITRDLTTNGVEDPTKIAAWKEEFSEWFIDDAAFFFYLFTLRYTMVDNRAKNTFWHYGKVATKNEAGELVYATDENGEFIYKFDFWDYDNDTSLGIDNAGKLEMDYGVEDNDKDLAAGNDEDSSPTYFRAANSTPFQRIIKYFANELPSKYAEYESAMSAMFDSEHLIKEFDSWQSQFPEELWRLDYERKYKRPYVNGSGSNWDNAIAWADKAPRYLADMMNGKKKYQRRQFERNQDFYMSSKFRGAKNIADMITLRGAGDLSGANLVIPQDATLHIVPYLNMYVNLSINNTGSFYFTQKCKAGEMIEIPYPSDKFEFNYIYGSSKIQNLGDLSPMYLQTATLGRGEKLKEIILGNSTEGYKNNNIKDLGNSVSSNNKLLEVLNIENLTGVSGSLPVQDIPSIKEIYAKGSGIESVTFARNGLIHKAELPESVSDLRLYDLYYLNDLSIENYNSLLVFVCENTPNIDEKVIIENSPNLIRIRVTDIDWTGTRSLDDASLLMKLASCKGIDANNQNTDLPLLTGKVEVGSIRQSEIQHLNALWPDLEIEYKDIIPQVDLAFYNEGANINSDEPIITFKVDQNTTLYPDQHDPAKNGMLSADQLPSKPDSEDGQYYYVFKDWNPSIEPTITEEGDQKYIAATANMNFFATFEARIKEYTVTWVDHSGRKIDEQKVPYGASASTSHIPTRANQANAYYLFGGWSESTSKVVGDMTVSPIWLSANPGAPSTDVSTDLSAVEVYSLAQYAKDQNNLTQFDNYIQEDDEITVQLGYMPEYENVESIVLEDAMKTYTGLQSEMVNTNIKLFNPNQSFTLALDFTPAYNANSAHKDIFVSCMASDYRGFNIAGASNTPTVQWQGSTPLNLYPEHNTTATQQYREILVVRYEKDSKELKVYTNNRFSASPIKENVLKVTNLWDEFDAPLVFGGHVNEKGAVTSASYAKGTIHYAKLWMDDLGEAECKRICSWVYDTLKFEQVGTQRYEMEDGGKVTASFVATELLEEPFAFENTRDDFSGWHESAMRDWLRNKVFAGIAPDWQQVLQSTKVYSLKSNTESIESGVSLIPYFSQTNTYDSLYLPAGTEIAENLVASNDAAYSLYESEQGPEALSLSAYGPFASNADRVKCYKGTSTPGNWNTRTPSLDERTTQVWVDKKGQTHFNAYYTAVSGGIAYHYKNTPAGVLLAFSI